MQGSGKTGDQPYLLDYDRKQDLGQAEEKGRFQEYTVNTANPDINSQEFMSGLAPAGKKITERSSRYYQKTGQMRPDIIPSKNDVEFTGYWQNIGVHRTSGVTQHQLMRIKSDNDSPVWHVKTPGRESRGEKIKRFVQKIIFTATRLTTKAHYFDNRQLLAQREIMAGNVYKEVMSAGTDFKLEYTFNEARSDHGVASEHLTGYRKGESCFKYLAEGGTKEIQDDYHPAVSLVVRRFLLGDQDYLKPDNYLFEDSNADQKGCKWLAIDFGMAFYSPFEIPKGCNLREFSRRVFKPSKFHRIQYKGRKTILTYFNRVGRNDEKHARIALEKIAAFSDERINDISRHIFDPEARKTLQHQLIVKRDQAKEILGQATPV